MSLFLRWPQCLYLRIFLINKEILPLNTKYAHLLMLYEKYQTTKILFANSIEIRKKSCFLLGFNPCTARQPLTSMELREKQKQKE